MASKAKIMKKEKNYPANSLFQIFRSQIIKEHIHTLLSECLIMYPPQNKRVILN